MAIKWIGSAWRAQLDSEFPSLVRFYIDFLRQDYPAVNDDYTYTAITEAANQPGSYNLTGGHGDALLLLTSKITVACRVLPTFAYNVATDQPIWSWYNDANNHLALYYEADDDMYTVKWKDGGTERTLKSAAYTSDEELQVWTDICFSFDSTTGDTSGSALYIDRAAVDTAWDGAIDAMGSNYEKLSIRHEAGTEGGYTINYLRVFSSYAIAAADVANDFRDIKIKEIYWQFNDESVGRSRWNITRHVLNYYITKEVAKQIDGSQAANTMGLTLFSDNGEFADDQYAAFDAANDVFNGLNSVGQRYLQQRCRVITEHWYSNLFETLFLGRVDEELFSRETSVGDISRVSISCEDMVGEVARKSLPYGKTYEDYSLCAATQETSLVHSIMRLATRKEYKNYLANSSFENAAITDSWAFGGAGSTWVRSTVSDAMFGDHVGLFTCGSVQANVAQVVTFVDDKKLNVGENYNFSIFLRSASVADNNIKLDERTTAGTVTDSTTAAYALAGGEGWKRFNVTHTVADSMATRLVATVTMDDEVAMETDGAFLSMDDQAINWWLLNNNNGAGGVESADDADSDTYDTMGFDCDSVYITHGWVPVLPYTSIWDYMKDIADATAARYCGMTADGTFRFRSILKAGYADPSAILTCDTVQGVVAQLTAAGANTIIVHGIQIVKETKESVVWSARACAQFDGGEPIHLQVNNGATWPAPAVYGPFWAKYGMLKSDGNDLQWESFPQIAKVLTDSYRDYYSIRYKTTKESKAVIGVKSPRLVQSISDSGYVAKSDLTVTIFDITTRSDAARLLLTNASGATRYINSILIIGLPILRYANAFLHDSFVNLGDVQRNGEIKFELGNDFIVTKAQVESLADYWWKMHDGKKHRYEVRLPGTRHYYEPGEWYTLDVGAVGTRENIDSTVVCQNVNIEQAAGELGSTSITFYEIEANWTQNSSALARYLAQGFDPQIKSGALIVAANGYEGQADYYCDGTADEVQINLAINWMLAHDGGKVQLTQGIYYVAAAIMMKNGVALYGVGAGTIIEKNGNYYAIHADGDEGAELDHVELHSMLIQTNASDTNQIAQVRLEYVDYAIVNGVTFKNSYHSCLQLYAVDYSIIGNDVFLNQALYDTFAGFGGDGQASGCIDCQGTASAISIFNVSNNRLERCYGSGINLAYADNCLIENNIIDKVWSSGIVVSTTVPSSKIQGNSIRRCARHRNSLGGISIVLSSCAKILLSDNIITDCGIGIYIGSSVPNTNVRNNNCYDNGQLINYPAMNGVQQPAIDGQSLSNATTAWDAAIVYEGDYSLKIIITTGGSNGDVRFVDNADTTDLHGFIPGYTYQFTAMARVPSSGGCAAAEAQIAFAYYDSGAWTVTTDAPTAQDTWEELDCGEITIPATATGAYVLMRVDAAASDGEYWNVDNVRIKTIGMQNDHEEQFRDLGTGTRIG